jgi:ERF superfamily
MNDERTELRSGVAESLPGDSAAGSGAAGSNGAGISGDVFFAEDESMNCSKSIAQLVGALAKAQTEFLPIKKTVVNTQFNSKYADLDAVIDATRPALSKNGIVIMQFPQSDVEKKRLTMISRMAHESGEWIESRLTLPATMRDQFSAQSIGSAMTYARRYMWQGLAGVAAEVDDDANTASDSGSKEAAAAVAKRKIAEAASAKIPPKTFQTAPLAPQDAPRDVPKEVLEGEARLCGGILRDFVSKTTNKGQGYYLLMVDNEELRIWGNPSFGQPSAKFSELLELGRGQFAQFVVKDETKGGKTFSMIRGITSIANREFDEDGAEILLRQPGE